MVLDRLWNAKCWFQGPRVNSEWMKVLGAELKTGGRIDLKKDHPFSLGYVNFEMSLWDILVEMSGKWLDMCCVIYLLLHNNLLWNLAANLY